MRATLLCAALAACTPSIATGAYLCGPESSCPTGQVCNGPDNTCVSPSVAEAFACDPGALHEPDQDLAHAFQLPHLDCVSSPVTASGCLAAGDTQNFLALDVPASCITVEVEARITFPVAFEPLKIELQAADGSSLGAGTDCKGAPSSDDNGIGQSCFNVTVQPGSHLGIGTSPVGGEDCSGTCNFNRYSLIVQLATPG
jgi:hypothetical protein